MFSPRKQRHDFSTLIRRIHPPSKTSSPPNPSSIEEQPLSACLSFNPSAVIHRSRGSKLVRVLDSLSGEPKGDSLRLKIDFDMFSVSNSD
ncbi:hypothetical protein QL285_058185 [Trifolium repens]|nr:hypothetical protein QL285_058185 [Trifolium repens]